MTLDDERRLLAVIRFGMHAWLVIGTVCLVAGSLIDRSPWWLTPMLVAAFMTAAEGWQERRVARLEREGTP